MLAGQVNNETMCLDQIQHRGERSFETGRLCVKNQTFIAVELIQGDFGANGILGLAPTQSSNSFIKTLKNEGVIDRMIVAFDFQDPEDVSQSSTVSFGYVDLSQVVNGEDGLSYFSNVGFNEWALLVDHILYNGVAADNTEGKSVVHTKIALIDSGNSSIQIPEAEFRKIQATMMGNEPTLEETILPDGKIQMKSDKPCRDIQNNFANLQFNIQETRILIAPKGYLYQSAGKCMVGVEGIPDNLNQIRLGSVFLRNFYTVLDFDNNYIMIGLNKEALADSRAAINGQIGGKTTGNSGLLWCVIVLVLLGGIGYYFYRKKQQEGQLFAKTEVKKEPSLLAKEAAPESLDKD